MHRRDDFDNEKSNRYNDYLELDEDGTFLGEDPGLLEEYEEIEEVPRKKSLALRLVALLTALFFIGVVTASMMPAFREGIGELVSRSQQLEKNIDTQRLQQAVVQVDVLASKEGSNLSVQQKFGTGFNISPEGVIVTNHHVIEGARNLTVKFGDNLYSAVESTSRPDLDLAVITLEGKDLPSVPLAEKMPSPGDKVRIVGNPLGMNNIVAEGTVDRYLKLKDKPVSVFSIDADIYKGNSGSPVFDSEGRVVGVVFAKYTREVDGKEETRGLALPIRELKNLR